MATNTKEYVIQLSVDDSGAIKNIDTLDKSLAAGAKSATSVKAELRAIQQELAKFEQGSEEFNKLSLRAGELKDRLNDASEAIKANAGNAVETLSNNVGNLGNRFATLDFDGITQDFRGIANSISGIKTGDITKGIQSAGSALASVGKALLLNPIFLIGAAIAAAVVYSKELLSLVDGVTSEQEAQLEIQKEQASLAKEQVDSIGQMEESLKRQGLSEKDIQNLKLQGLETAIAEQKAVIETQKTQAAGQIAAAERNFKYLKGFLDFITLPQKKLTEFFFNFYNGAVDLINKLGFSLEKVDINAVTAGFDAANNTIAKLLFDPDEVKKEAEKVSKEAEKSLIQLENTRDGILNQRDAQTKVRNQAAQAEAQKNSDALQKIEDERLAAELKNQQEITDLVNQLMQENIDEAAKIASDAEKARLDALVKANEERIAVQDLLFKNESDLFATEQEKQIDAVNAKYEAFFLAAANNAEAEIQLTAQRDEEIKKINDKAAADRIASEKLVASTKLQLAAQSFTAIADLITSFQAKDAAAAKKQFAIAKAFNLAAALTNTYLAVTAALATTKELFPGQRFVEAGIAGTVGLAQVAKIASTKFGSGGGGGGGGSVGGGGSSGGGGGTASAGGGGGGAPTFNPVNTAFLNNRPPQATPAYVLSGAVTDAQVADQKIKEQARL